MTTHPVLPFLKRDEKGKVVSAADAVKLIRNGDTLATGGFVGFLAWLFVGSIAASLVVGLIAFIFALFADMVPAGGGRGGSASSSGGKLASRSSRQLGQPR